MVLLTSCQTLQMSVENQSVVWINIQLDPQEDTKEIYELILANKQRINQKHTGVAEVIRAEDGKEDPPQRRKRMDKGNRGSTKGSNSTQRQRHAQERDIQDQNAQKR